MRKITFLTVLFFTVFSVLFADENPIEPVAPGALTGRIVDEMGYVLPGATITIEGSDVGTVSDVNGFFRIPGLKNGTYTVKITYIGYNPEERHVTISGDRTATLSNVAMREGILIKEVVVTALNPQHKAMSQQRNNINISNVISADQVSRFPDSNIGDALKRIPGISVQYDQGEARFGHIRGTSPDLSSVTIDGTRVPSAESGVRSVQLDLIPSDMVQTIEVNKVITPDMDADAIGGSVNLITKSQPARRRITAMAGSGYNFISEKPTWNLGFSYSNRFVNDKLGFVAAISFQDNPLGSDNVEFEWDKAKNESLYVSDYQIRQYFVHRQRHSYSLESDYVFNPDHKIEFNGMLNKRYDWENRYRTRIDKIKPNDDGTYTGRVNRQVKFGNKDTRYARLEDQQVMTFSLKGEHHINKLSMDWKANYSKASERRPNERYINYRRTDVKFKNNLSNPRAPKASDFSTDIDNFNELKLDEFTESLQYTFDEDLSGKIDFKLPLNISGNRKNSLSFGASIRLKTKDNNVDYYEYEPVNQSAFDALVASHLVDQTRENFLAGDYANGKFPDREFFGDMQLDGNSEYKKSRIDEEDVAIFDASETISTAYLRYDQRLADKADIILGLRAENTRSKYNANKWDDKAKTIEKINGKADSYINLLPSIIAKWDVSNDFKVKAAWTNTLARPKYIDLAPIQNMKRKDNEISVGNPDLRPTKSMNFDLMAEYYANGGIFSAGVFYKDISDFIVEERLTNHTLEGHEWTLYKRPFNAGNADLLGLEVAIQQNLTFLPGLMQHFNVYTNYTYNHSKVKNFNYKGRENDELSLPGTPAHTFNAVLGFDNRKFSARLSYNFASDFIDELGTKAFKDRYYDKVHYLDFNANMKIGNRVNVFANANNILNQPLRYYQGSSEHTMQAEYYNIRLDAGVKLNF